MAKRKKTVKKGARRNPVCVCEYCGAKAARKTKLNHTFGRGARMIVVTNVDSVVCDSCGRSYLEGDILKRLDRVLLTPGEFASIERVAVVDFSKIKPNKFYGRQIVIVGDRRAGRQQNAKGKLFRFLNTRIKRSVDIRAANKREARLAFLEQFNLKRMPPGFIVIEVKPAS